ncbi:MAG: amidohydrolase [candidate division WOR-3 bacterium]
MPIFSAKRIYTFDEENGVFRNLLVKDTKILKVTDESISIPDEPKIDFEDKFIVPGFIDSHVHILGTGLQFLLPNFSTAQSLEEVFDLLLTGRSKNKGLKFLIGYNLEPENLKEKRFPTRIELDKVIKDIPVILYRIDGHSAVLNTKGLEFVFGSGLEVGVELDHYKIPSGVVRGKAFEIAAKKFRQFLNPDIKIEAISLACKQAIVKGITTIVAMIGSDAPDDDSFQLLLKVKDKLPIEVVPFYQTQDVERVKALGLTRIGGCILIDGSFGSRTAALTEDYEDEPGNKGILYFQDEELLNFFQEASAAGLQIAVHAIGDRAIDQVVSCYEKFLQENLLRHRIEHAELLNDNLIERIAKLGIILSVQPAFEYYWGGSDKMYAERLGERYKLTNPYRKLIDTRITLCGGSDSPITPLDPVLGIKSAVNHPNLEHRLTHREAFQLFTKNGAYAIFKENEIGVLKPNFLADFLVLSADPFETLDFQILEVYKAGKRIFP